MSQAIDLTGQKFGMLTVLERAGTSKDGKAMWRCRCDCGVEKEIIGKNLRTGNTKSCGCFSKRKGRRIQRDLTNQTFGHLLVLEEAIPVNGKYRWRCVCDVCGKEKIAYESNLLSGKVKSCGCTRYSKGSKVYKHGACTKDAVDLDPDNARLYEIWTAIKQRCLNVDCNNYARYGARGIKICTEWQNCYLSFKKWAIENGYRKGLEIDRIDNNGDYCPENCRWATRHTQVLNRRNTLRYSMNGETKTLCEWVEIYNIPYRVVYSRLRAGWNFERAILTPYTPLKSQRNYHYK